MTIHNTLPGCPATEGARSLDRQKQSLLKQESVIHKGMKISFLMLIIVSIYSIARSLSIALPKSLHDFLPVLLIPSVLFTGYFAAMLGFALNLKLERKAANRSYQYIKATITKKYLNLYIEEESEPIMAIQLEDILKTSYDNDTNILTIEYNCESYDNLDYIAILDLEDVFIPPLRDSLL